MPRRTALAILAFAAGAAAVSLAVACAAIWWASPKHTEASLPAQSAQSRAVEWFYWLDTSQRVIQRSRLDGSGVAQTVVTSTGLTTTARDWQLTQTMNMSIGPTTATTKSGAAAPMAAEPSKRWLARI